MTTQGNVMIITGASSGFGRLTALQAAGQGYRVVLMARRAELLDEVVRNIQGRGGTAMAIVGDVNNPEDQQRVVDETLRSFGRIDVLVNNAGVPLQQNFVESSLGELRRQWETNVLSMVLLTKRALPALLESKGVVINIGSLAGHFSIPGWGMYFSTKVSVRSLSDSLRRELRPYGVRVSLVEPGPFETEFAERAGTFSSGGGLLPPEMVVRAILRLAARPRALAIVPWPAAPFIAIGSLIEQAFPWLLDLAFWAVGKAQMRKVHKRSLEQLSMLEAED